MRYAALVLTMVLALAGNATAQGPAPIVSERTIDAPIDLVWAAWATAEGLRAWLAPHAEIDLRLGGSLRTNYDPQGRLGDPGTIENTILSFEPRRMLSIKVATAPAGLPFPNAIHRMWTVIYFEPAGEERTRIRVVGMGFGPEEEDQRMRAFFERGNEATLVQLQNHFANGGR